MDSTNFWPRSSTPLWALGLSAALVAIGFRRRDEGFLPPREKYGVAGTWLLKTHSAQKLVGYGFSNMLVKEGFTLKSAILQKNKCYGHRAPARFRTAKTQKQRARARLASRSTQKTAGGMTFFGLLAIFPAIAALVSIYGLFADPASLADQVSRLGYSSGRRDRGSIDQPSARNSTNEAPAPHLAVPSDRFNRTC